VNDPIIHAEVGAQFGDLEFDVGKSVRWTQWYADHVHVTDVNLGTQRYWVVNWAITFPNVKHHVIGINYFAVPVNFRKKQWELYQRSFQVDPEDWILWVDAHEGMSFDTTSLPDDYQVAPFRSWVWREVTRAESQGFDRVVVPFFVFLRSDETQNVEFPGSGTPEQDVPDTSQSVSVPYYTANGGITRLIKVSALLEPDFDWASLDTLVATLPDAGVKMQIISYAYCHWQYLDIEDPAVGVPPMNEENDYGWRQRKQISRVRPIAEFPVDTWNPDDQPVGLPGPWCTDTMALTNPDLEVIEEFPHTPPAPEMAGLMTPLYDTYFRLNLRDGVWYEEGLSGNIPLIWDTDNQEWVTNYDPALWPDHGVDAALDPDDPRRPRL
jgi:hypothetical protein